MEAKQTAKSLFNEPGMCQWCGSEKVEAPYTACEGCWQLYKRKMYRCKKGGKIALVMTDDVEPDVKSILK